MSLLRDPDPPGGARAVGHRLLQVLRGQGGLLESMALGDVMDIADFGRGLLGSVDKIRAGGRPSVEDAANVTLGAAALLPGVPNLARLRKGVQSPGTILRDAGHLEESLKAARAERAARPKRTLGEMRAYVEGKGRYTGINLRNMTPEDALEAASEALHLRPRGDGFVGAPAWVKGENGLEELRAKIDDYIDRGIKGHGWYRRTREGIAEIAGRQPTTQGVFSNTLGFTSRQAEPDYNLRLALVMQNAYERGIPIEDWARLSKTTRARSVYFPHQIRVQGPAPEGAKVGQGITEYFGDAELYTAGREAGDLFDLGPKTDIYGGLVDPSLSGGLIPHTGANDTRMGEVFGYFEPGGKGSVSEANHVFMDGEMLLAAKRAKERHPNLEWTAANAQETAWTTQKAENLMAAKEGRTFEEAVDMAASTYPESYQKFVANMTQETMPGKASGLFADAGSKLRPEEKQAWDDIVSFVRPDEGGDLRDLAYDVTGTLQQPGFKATGVWDGVTSPMRGSRPLALDPPLGGKAGLDASESARNQLEFTELYKGGVTGQDAMAGNRMLNDDRVGAASSAFLEYSPAARELDPDEIVLLSEILGRRGMTLVDMQQVGSRAGLEAPTKGVLGLQVGDMTGVQLKKGMGDLQAEITEALPGRFRAIEAEPRGADLSTSLPTRAGSSRANTRAGCSTPLTVSPHPSA